MILKPSSLRKEGLVSKVNERMAMMKSSHTYQKENNTDAMKYKEIFTAGLSESILNREGTVSTAGDALAMVSFFVYVLCFSFIF